MSLHAFVVLPSVRLCVLLCVCVCMPLSLSITLLTFLSHAQSRLVFDFPIFHCLSFCVLCLYTCVCFACTVCLSHPSRRVVHALSAVFTCLSWYYSSSARKDALKAVNILLLPSLHSIEVSMSVSPSQHHALHGRLLSNPAQGSDSLIDRAARFLI
uniref:Uncharacterized protein n=1 Tax=Anopheles darlingi TaxID=43151 RepID=A0A2M4D1S1_ANODA